MVRLKSRTVRGRGWNLLLKPAPLDLKLPVVVSEQRAVTVTEVQTPDLHVSVGGAGGDERAVLVDGDQETKVMSSPLPLRHLILLTHDSYSHVRCPDKEQAACVHTETGRTKAEREGGAVTM